MTNTQASRSSALSLIILWNIIPTLILTMSTLIILKDILNTGYSFRTITYPHAQTIAQTPGGLVLKANEPIVRTFIAKDDYLGMISIQFIPDEVVKDTLQFSLFETGQSQPLYSREFNTTQIAEVSNFPFGFPEIVHSRGKSYQFTLVSKEGADGNQLAIADSNNFFESSYQIPAEVIMSSWGSFANHLLTKLGLALHSSFTIVKICVYLSLTIIYAIALYQLIAFYKKNISVITLPLLNINMNIRRPAMKLDKQKTFPFNMYFHTTLSQFFLIMVPMSLLIDLSIFYYFTMFLLLYFCLTTVFKSTYFLSVQCLLVALATILLAFSMTESATIFLNYAYITTLFLVVYISIETLIPASRHSPNRSLNVIKHVIAIVSTILIRGFNDARKYCIHQIASVSRSSIISAPTLKISSMTHSSSLFARVTGVLIASLLVVVQTALLLSLFVYFISVNYSFMTLIQSKINS